MAVPEVGARKNPASPRVARRVSLARCGRAPCCTSARRSVCARACAAMSPTTMTRASRRARLMLQVAALETIVVPSEAHALILEANLIKEYHPKYNIALRDDKSYPYIKVTVVGGISARMGDASPRRRRQPVLRAVYGRRRHAPRAQHRETPLHGAVVQLRYATANAGASVSRLLHQAVQGTVHPRADAGRISRDDRRGTRVPRRSDG